MLKIANNGNFEKSSYLSSFKIYRAETLNLSSLQIYLLQTIVKNRKNWPKIVKKIAENGIYFNMYISQAFKELQS